MIRKVSPSLRVVVYDNTLSHYVTSSSVLETIINTGNFLFWVTFEESMQKVEILSFRCELSKIKIALVCGCVCRVLEGGEVK